jgi:uncharacterized protein (TIGR03435 family)
MDRRFAELAGIGTIRHQREDGVVLDCEQRNLRLRQLPQKRFRLAVHRVTRIVDGYALVVPKGGPRLQPTKGESAPGVVFPSGMRLQGVSVAYFAAMLAHPVDRPVVDKTGIAGTYDISPYYAPDGATDTALPSIFTVVPEQLGLRLEPQKVPVEMLVIDHVERIPAEN